MAEHVRQDSQPYGVDWCVTCATYWPCLPYRLAAELESAAATEEADNASAPGYWRVLADAVIPLLAEAERRGAVKTLRDAAEQWQKHFGQGLTWTPEGIHDWLADNADRLARR